MRTDHSDKTWQPGALQGRSEWLDEVAEAERYRLDHMDPAERAALPTKDEQTRLDSADALVATARTSYDAALLAYRNAGQLAVEGRRVVRSRTRNGDYAEQANASESEQRRLDAAALDAKRSVEEAEHFVQRAAREANRVRSDVAAAGGARRRAIEAKADYAAWVAFRRAKGDARSDGELRDDYAHKGVERIRVRFGGA